jgi:hypothetical protein
MKKLLQKSALFLTALFIIKLSFVIYYGDKFVYQSVGIGGSKYESEYRKTEFAKQEYNTVFIGSSRTAFGISPVYFDYLNNQKTHSYNYGVISAMPPQTFDWCAEMIQTKPSLKYVFFELSAGYIGLDKQNDRVLTFFKPSIPRVEYENKFIKYDAPIQNISLESFMKKEDKSANPKYFSPAAVQQAHRRNLQIEEPNLTPAPPLNEDYWERISELIELAESRQIHLYFFIAPRIKTDREFQIVYPVYQKLEGRYKLQIAHYEEALYRIENSFDVSHLNSKGTKRFTEMMAERFKIQDSDNSETSAVEIHK